jgi:hypothetical protein
MTLTKTKILGVVRGKDEKIFCITESAFINREYIGEIMTISRWGGFWYAYIKCNDAKSTMKQISLNKLD